MKINMIVPLEVGIAVRDVDRMRQFYEEVLGFTLISEVTVPAARAQLAAMNAAGYTAVRLQTPQGERIKLLAPVNPPAAEAATEYILDKANATYLTFIVDDIEMVIDQLIGLGVIFLTGPRRIEVRPGTYLAFFRDPEGNVIEIVQYSDITSYRPDFHKRTL